MIDGGPDLNSTVHPGDRTRLCRQHAAILARLKAGPATNVDLSRIGLRFGARIKELRDHGYAIDVARVGPGVNLYTLDEGR